MGEKPEGEAPATPVATPAAKPAVAPAEPTTPAEPAEPKPEPEPEPQPEPAAEDQPKKKENGWIKFLRIIIWIAVAICITAGQSLIQTSKLSKAYANGSHNELLGTGNTLFYVGLVIGIANLIWGVTRWILRYKREKWSVGKIIGKLIGGGIWRTLAITPVIIFAAAVVAPRLCNNIESSIIDQQAKLATSSDKIIADYEAKKITPQQYFDYRFAAAFDTENLPKEYQTNKPELSPIPELISFAKEHPKDISAESFKKIIEIYNLSNIEFGTAQEAEKAAKAQEDAKKPRLFSQPAYAATRDVTILSEAIMSPSKKFVLFYTEAGDDKITVDEAKKLAQMLDDIIAGYKNNLGLEYTYYNRVHDKGALKDVQDVLTLNGLPKDALDTAMPVYVANPYRKASSTYAFYTEINDASDILLDIGAVIAGGDTADFAKITSSTPTYPFVVLLPKSDESDGRGAVTAHEIGHHYSSMYCRSKGVEGCTNDLFPNETLANYTSVRALQNQPTNNLINENHYNYSYRRSGTSDNISKAVSGFTGYPAFPLFVNYGEIVPNGTTHILQSALEEKPLDYLYNQAGAENYKKVMQQTTNRNITGYDRKYSLTNDAAIPISPNPCTEICKVTREMNSSASAYYYMSSAEYKNIWIEYSDAGSTVATLFGKNGDTYENLASGDKFSYLMKREDESKYELYILAIASYNIGEEKAQYSLSYTTKELADLMKVAETETGEPVTDLGDGCVELNMDSLLELPNQLMALARYLLETLQRNDESEDYTSAIEQFDLQQKQLRHDTDYAKAQLAGYRISACETPFNSDESDETIKAAIKKSVSGPLQTITFNADGQKYNVLIGYNLLTRQAKAFAIVREDGQTVLYTLIVQEK
ncbi:hypothetical protein IKQ38_04095 [Candidatus Saccharibacteria bacterium]|nr:hypothetical protein [Candidatus Saccharibacteria bacterium]